MSKIYKNVYVGISYPHILANKIVWWLWRKFLCPKGRHLLDECWSPDEHYLYCDACQKFYIFIDEVIDERDRKLPTYSRAIK